MMNVLKNSKKVIPLKVLKINLNDYCPFQMKDKKQGSLSGNVTRTSHLSHFPAVTENKICLCLAKLLSY